MRSDAYNIKKDQESEEERAYTECFYKNCDFWKNFVDEYYNHMMKQPILYVILLIENAK